MQARGLEKRSSRLPPIVRNAERLQQVLRRHLTRLKRAMDASVAHLSAVLARELESRATILLQRLDQDAGLIAALLHRVGAEAREGVLRPVRCLDVDELRQFFVGLCAEDLKEGLEEVVDGGWARHAFDALGERLGDLNAEFFCAAHDPEVADDGGVGEDGGLIDLGVGGEWRWVVDELVVVLGPEHLGELDEDFAKSAVAETLDSLLD